MTKRGAGFISFVLFVILASCVKKEAQKPAPVAETQMTAKFVVSQDEFDGSTRYQMFLNYLPDDSIKPPPNPAEVTLGKDFSLIEFDANGSQNAKGEVLYFLFVSYIGKEWLYVTNSYESLFLIIDGKRVGLKCFSSNRKYASFKHVEMVFYPVDFDLLVQISKASNVKIKLSGDEGSEIRYFAKENINNFAEFVRRFGPGELSRKQVPGQKGEKK